MFGFTVLENDIELFKVTWGDVIDVAHVINLYGAKHIKAQDLYGQGYYYDIPFRKVLDFLATRTVPKTRVNIDEIVIKIYKLREYNPLEMCRKDHGVSMTDYLWVRFNGEDLVYADVRVRPV